MEKLLCHIAQSVTSMSGVPEWIQLIPSSAFNGVDGRGPFIAPDLNVIIKAMNGRKIPVDENHATELAGDSGRPAHARGWIVEMQARGDELWGKVEWTQTGRKLVEDRAYGFVSPALLCTKSKPHKVMQISSVALVNSPNIETLKSLHKRKVPMNEALLKLLGLEDGADDAAITEAVKMLNAKITELTNVLAMMGTIRKALGVEDDASADDLVVAINARKPVKQEDASVVDGLQEQIKVLNSQLVTLSTSAAKDKATSVIDAAIEATTLVPSLRDHYIARHMKDPESVETELKVMPSINAGSLGGRKIDENTSISAADEQVCQLMGIDPKEFAKTSKTIKELN